MASSQDTFDPRISDLIQWVTELHTMLEFTVQRVRQLETSVGRDAHAIPRTQEWEAKVEASFTQLLKNHNWAWLDLPDSADQRIAAMSYQQMLRLGEMMPLDRCLALWHEYVPKEIRLPHAWTPFHKPAPSTPNTFAETSDKDLGKRIKKERK